MTSHPSASPVGRARWFYAIVAIVVVAGMGLVTVNVWLAAALVREQRSNSREHDFWMLCQPGSTATEREGAFRRLVAVHNTEWRSADLRNLNLTRAVMSAADLQFAVFVRANLAGAQFDGAKLCATSFELADLTGAQFNQANLKEARLLQASAKGASFRRADLAASLCEQVDAENGDFLAANLSDANCLMANFTGAKLMGANFSGAKLESAMLKHADLALARLDGADLTDADFTDANWWRARGLTMKQIDLLKKKFPPAETAPAALKEDYARWVGESADR